MDQSVEALVTAATWDASYFSEEDMKTIFSQLLMLMVPLVVTLSVFSTRGSMQAPETYPLVCRGSSAATIWFKPERRLVLKFKRGTAPAGSALAPGECSWLDRGMYEAEPDMVVQQVREGGDDDAQYRWTNDLNDPNNYWTFDVYNDRQGQLLVLSSRKQQRDPVKDIITGLNIGDRVQAVRRNSPIEISEQVRPEAEKPKTTENAKLPTFKGNGGPQDVKESKLPGDTQSKLDMGSRIEGLTRREELLESRTAPPYVTLSLRQPYVADKGYLTFALPFITNPVDNEVTWGGYYESLNLGSLDISLKAPAAGLYLINCTVKRRAVFVPKGGSYEIKGPDESKIVSGRVGEQSLMFQLDAGNLGWYSFELNGQREIWTFKSCTMSTAIPR